jgi:hypothetical protein
MLTVVVLVLFVISATPHLHALGQGEAPPGGEESPEAPVRTDAGRSEDRPESGSRNGEPDGGAREGEVVMCATPPCEDPFEMETIAQGGTGGVTEERYEVIRDGERFREVWRALHRNRLDPPTPPSIDFEEQVVVAAFLGRRPTGGYGVEITGICRDERTDTAVIRVARRRPDPDAMVTQALTAPFHLVRTMALPDGARFCEVPRE